MSSVPERLQQRQAELREGAERRRRDREEQSVREERSDFFTAAFSGEREAVEALLEPPSEVEEEAPEAAGRRLEEAGRRLQDLQRLLTDSVRFLAPYEVRQAQAALGRLQALLSERRLQLQPKKRFAFRALKREAAQPQPPPQPAPQAQARPHQPPPTEEPLCGFSGAQGQELELGAAELLQRDVLLFRLSRCRVRLRGNPNTLSVRDCQDCTILCGPISTSVLVEGCGGCLFALACQQLRTHCTSRTSFYVQVTSRAILEDCSGIRFAPYSWTYPGIDSDFQTSGLDRSRDNWRQVDDFNWLASDEPSPNWSVIPEEERVTNWD